jgi:hypothetical protein
VYEVVRFFLPDHLSSLDKLRTILTYGAHRASRHSQIEASPST